MTIDPIERTILLEFKERVEKQYPGEIVEIILFGSEARGDATAESDIDILVITRFDDWEKGDAIRAIGYSLDIDIGSRLSIQVLSQDHVEKLRGDGYQFIKSVDHEGIVL